MEHATPDKPEVIQLADLMGLDRDTVVGKLLRLWIWADQNSIDGFARGVTLAFIDEICRTEKFGENLVETGWMRVRKGGIFFPNFARHNGNSAKQRILTRDRVRTHRNVAPVTPVTPKAHQRREEKRREEESKKEENNTVVFPDILDTKDFREAWAEWVAYRKERKLKAYVPRGAQMQLTRISKFGHDGAVAAVAYSMAQGYNGVYEENTHGQDGRKSDTGSGGKAARIAPGGFRKGIRVTPLGADQSP